MSTHMTSRERLLAAIRHEEGDRLPIVPRYHNYCMVKLGDHLIHNQLRMNEEYGWDNYLVVPSLTDALWPNYFWNVRLKDFSCLEKAGLRLEVKITEQQDSLMLDRTFRCPAGALTDKARLPKSNSGSGIRPNPHYFEYLVKDRHDLECLQYFLLDPGECSDFETLREARALLGSNGLLMAYVNSALDDKLGCVYGSENLMMTCYDDPEFCRRLLAVFHEHTRREVKSLLEREVDGVHTTWYWSSLSAGWSPELISELYLPMVQDLAALTHNYGKLIYYYDDGYVMPIAKNLRDAGVDVLGTCAPPPAANNDLERLKAEIGDKVCLHGNTDVIELIRSGTPEKIRESVRRTVEQASRGGGFILGTSDSIREDTPEKNVVAWTQAAREYAQYPRG